MSDRNTETSSLNYGDTEDTEIISGDKGDLVPIHDSAIDANAAIDVEQGVEYTETINPPSEVGDNSIEVAELPQQDVSIPVQAEVIADSSEPAKVKERPGGWQRIRNFFFGRSADITGRLNHLTETIEDAPEAYVNYVLRAELYMQMREYALAHADFQRAYELSEVQFELADWGLLEQAIRDRALVGLEKAKRRLR